MTFNLIVLILCVSFILITSKWDKDSRKQKEKLKLERENEMRKLNLCDYDYDAYLLENENKNVYFEKLCQKIRIPSLIAIHTYYNEKTVIMSFDSLNGFVIWDTNIITALLYNCSKIIAVKEIDYASLITLNRDNGEFGLYSDYKNNTHTTDKLKKKPLIFLYFSLIFSPIPTKS